MDAPEGSPQPTPSGLLGLALVVGVPLGFIGPLVFLEWLTSTYVPYPTERSYVASFVLPLIPGSLVACAPSTRPWGLALLAGSATGVVLLVTWLWLILSSTS